ncbi:MAG: tetratricopeptide repeat protein, partial [Cyanobacteria bacterium J06555_13]
MTFNSISRSAAVKSLNRRLRQNAVEPSYQQTQSASSVRRQPDITRHYASEHNAFLLDPMDEARLAECLMDYESAERLYHKSLLLRQEELGDHHPDLIVVLSYLAAFYCRQTRYEKAEPFLHKVLAMQARYEPDALLTANNSYYLAQIYQHQKRYGKADGLYQKALAIFRQQLGHNHARTERVYNDLMAMIVTAIEEGKFAEYNAGPTRLDLDKLSETYSWAKPNWQKWCYTNVGSDPCNYNAQ